MMSQFHVVEANNSIGDLMIYFIGILVSLL